MWIWLELPHGPLPINDSPADAHVRARPTMVSGGTARAPYGPGAGDARGCTGACAGGAPMRRPCIAPRPPTSSRATPCIGANVAIGVPASGPTPRRGGARPVAPRARGASVVAVRGRRSPQATSSVQHTRARVEEHMWDTGPCSSRRRPYGPHPHPMRIGLSALPAGRQPNRLSLTRERGAATRGLPASPRPLRERGWG